MSESLLLAAEAPATESLLAAVPEATVPAANDPPPEQAPAKPIAAVADPPEPVATPNQRSTVLAAVQSARDLPPGVRDRLQSLVQQAVTLDVSGEPLLATRQVLDLLAQGLPPVLRHDVAAEVQRPVHPDGDAFFALQGEDLSDQQAEQIARQQLQRAGLLRTS